MAVIRVTAKTANGFRVIGYANNTTEAQRIGDKYMLSLDQETDECPEIAYEPVKRATAQFGDGSFRSGI